VSGHVLEEAPLGLDGRDVILDEGPEVAGVGLAAPLPGVAEWLARVAARDAIHDSTPRARVEGSQVRPDRRDIQPCFFHATHKRRGGTGFPLHITNGSMAGLGDGDAEFETAVSGTKSHAIHATSTWSKELVWNARRITSRPAGGRP
jgi:hypothetical protein